MSDDAWRRVAEDVFEYEAEWLDPIDVLAKVGETNTCGNLDSPVEVWIDKAGRHLLRVYDAAEQERLRLAYFEQQRRLSCPGCGEEPFLG